MEISILFLDVDGEAHVDMWMGKGVGKVVE